MRILFRVDSSSMIGVGHLMRSLVLAQQYANAEIVFACQDLPGTLKTPILEQGFQLQLLKNHDKNELRKIVRKLHIDLLVIDHYDIDFRYEQYIKKSTGVELLCFDDLYDKHYCDIVLNHNAYAKKNRYKHLVPKHCEIRCGSKYTLIRDEFKRYAKRSYKKSIKSIFVAIGGTDHLNINQKILEVLLKFTSLDVNLITTSANKKLTQLEAFCQEYTNIKLHINADNMAELMAKSDLAIVTPSVTVHEVMVMKLPFIAIKTASNQRLMYSYLQQKGYKVLKEYDSKRLYAILDEVIDCE